MLNEGSLNRKLISDCADCRDVEIVPWTCICKCICAIARENALLVVSFPVEIAQFKLGVISSMLMESNWFVEVRPFLRISLLLTLSSSLCSMEESSFS